MVKRLERGDYITGEQVEAVTEAALNILRDVGMKILDGEMLAALKKLGYAEKAGRICLEPVQCRDFIERLRGDDAARAEIEANRSRRDLEGVLISYCMRLDNPASGRNEPFNTETLIQATKFATLVSEKYGGFGSYAPGIPADVPIPLQSLAKYKIGAEYGNGTLPKEPTSLLAAGHMFGMGEVMGQPIRRLPVYPVSPLSIGGDSATIVWKYAEKLESFYVFSMPMLGCTAPLSVSQGLAMNLAEILGSAMFMHALTGLRPLIRPNILPLDFQTVNYAFGAPRKFHYECLAEDFLAQLLDMPVNYHSTNIHTNSAVPGVQSDMEKTSLMTAGAMLGATRFYCFGMVSMDEVFSPAELILDTLRLSQVGALVRGPELDDPSGAAEVILAQMDKGFLTSKKTLREHKEYVNYSPLLNRFLRDYYDKGRNTETLREAQSIAEKLFAGDAPLRVTAEQKRELDAIYAEAEKEL